MSNNGKETGIIQEQGFIVPGGFDKISDEEKERLEKESRDKK